jgi:hypothetical protein
MKNRLSSLLIHSLLATSTVVLARGVPPQGIPVDTGRRMGCGAPPPTAEHLKVAAQLAEEERQAAQNIGSSVHGPTKPKAAPLVVDTYFHVVAAGKQPSDGYITVGDQVYDIGKTLGTDG